MVAKSSKSSSSSKTAVSVSRASTSRSSTPVSTGNWLSYSNQGATRNQQLSQPLVTALSKFAPQMGLKINVFSGGQPLLGTSNRRTGSVRHDGGNAADVRFSMNGRPLSWTNPGDVPVFKEIVQRAHEAGLTGFGAGPGYMSPGSMHIGFGTPGVWGSGGKGANAPGWLREAFNTPLSPGARTPAPTTATALLAPAARSAPPQASPLRTAQVAVPRSQQDSGGSLSGLFRGAPAQVATVQADFGRAPPAASRAPAPQVRSAAVAPTRAASPTQSARPAAAPPTQQSRIAMAPTAQNPMGGGWMQQTAAGRGTISDAYTTPPVPAAHADAATALLTGATPGITQANTVLAQQQAADPGASTLGTLAALFAQTEKAKAEQRQKEAQDAQAQSLALFGAPADGVGPYGRSSV